MTSPYWDDLAFDSMEYDDDGEAAEYYDDGDADADSRAAMARRRRLVAQAQRRRAAQQRSTRVPARAGTRVPAPQRVTPQAAVKAINNLDLDTKVQEDRFRAAMAATSRRMSRSEYAAVAGVAVNQLIESFDAPDNAYLRAALRLSPVLLLSPQRRGTGAEALLKDPRVVAGAAVAAITVLGENRSRFSAASSIEVLGTSELTVGQSDRFIADVLDRSGRPTDQAVTWSSDAENVAKIDRDTGSITPVGPGTAVITAQTGALRRRIRVTVRAAPSNNPR